MKKAVTVITTVSALLFFLAVFYLTLGIFLDRKSGPENAAARYETLLLSARQTASRYKYGTTEFADNFVKAIGDINDFAKIDFELNDTLIYSYPPKNYSMPSSDFSKDFSEICLLQNGSKIKLSASIYTMRPTSIYNHAKVSFIIILVGTLTTIFLIIYTAITESKEPLDDSLFYDDVSSPDSSDVNEIPVYARHEEHAEEEPQDDDKRDENLSDEDNSEFEEQVPETTVSENDANNTETETQQSKMELTSEELTAIKEIISTEKEYAEVEEGGDFVNPKDIPAQETACENQQEEPCTTVLDEESLKDNIAKELENQEDMSLVIIRLTGIEKSSMLYKKTASLLEKQFKENGIIHAYSSDGFAIILKNFTLNSSTAIAEPLHAQISDLVNDYNSDVRVTVGISSKAGREIESERIIKEAVQAEAHAKEDINSPIVAFRVNLEKYKMLMSKKSELQTERSQESAQA